MGYVDDVQNHCSPQEISEEQQAVQIIQQSHHQQQQEQQEQQDQMTAELLQHELINDIIVNDLVIIDGSCLQQASASNEEIINCHFDKDGQMNENYYIEHCHESETVSEAAINESSNEVCSAISSDQFGYIRSITHSNLDFPFHRFLSKAIYNCVAAT